MKTNQLIAITAAILSVYPIASALAQETTPPPATVTMPLWPTGKMPGHGAKEPEKMLPARGDGATRITNVSEPAISLYKTSKTQNATSAVILCPGGGYSILAMAPDLPAWLNSIGLTVVVLKYRVPNNHEGAYQDLQRAMRLVRHNAANWNIASNHIGVMGISAGGHLCARLSANGDKATYPKLDNIDEEALRPDFAILIVPAYLSQIPGHLSKNVQVNQNTPPTFILHPEDDKPFIPGTKLYQAALEAAKVENEFFNPATGGHSCPLKSNAEIGQWPKKCQSWLIKEGIL